jgi:undecaprenyl phosphate-alpha-L-ara4N flippase subunit ArnE
MQILTILACVAAIVAGQLLFKLAAIELGSQSLMALATNLRAALLLGVALLLYAAATFAWVWVLQSAPLSRAYSFMSLSFVAVPILAAMFLGETLSLRTAAGTALIVAGILVSVSEL